MQNRIETKAYAKINLLLDVDKKRDDGYHDISTIFQRIDIYDDIVIEKTNLPFEMNEIDGIDKESRLEYKACKYFFECANLDMYGLKVTVKKSIPERAGLGGGSSDAASVLLMLNKLYDNVLSFQKLCEIGLRIGSDVPFFLYNQACMLGFGRGEELKPIKGFDNKHILIVLSNVEKKSTKESYEKLDLLKKDFDKQNYDFEKSVESQMDLLYNDFELIYANDVSTSEIIDLLYANGSICSHLCGAGSACFGIFDDDIKMNKAMDDLESHGYKCIKTKNI